MFLKMYNFFKLLYNVLVQINQVAHPKNPGVMPVTVCINRNALVKPDSVVT